MSSRVSITIEDGVARVVMDDGKVNAMSAELMREINAALDTAEKAGAVVVLYGRPGIFSAGFDLKTFTRGFDATIEMLRGGAELLMRLLAFPQPVMTVCTGNAYPMGAFIMLASDVRLCLAGPWQIGMNEVAIGLAVPNFALALARHRLTPQGFARVATAPMFAPEEALRLGYLDQIVAGADLEGAVAVEARRIRALDLSSFVATKRRINGPTIDEMRLAVEAEMAAATSVPK